MKALICLKKKIKKLKLYYQKFKIMIFFRYNGKENEEEEEVANKKVGYKTKNKNA